MKKKNVSARRAVTLMLLLSALLVYLLTMGYITYLTAQFVRKDVDPQAMLERIGINEQLDTAAQRDPGNIPGWSENRVHEAVARLNDDGEYYWLDIKGIPAGMRMKISAAACAFDENGEAFAGERDYLYFGYMSEEGFDEKGENAPLIGYARVPLDFSALPENIQKRIYRHPTLGIMDRFIRVTGVINGAEIIPVSIESIGEDNWSAALAALGPSKSYVDTDGGLVEEYDYDFNDVKDYLEWKPIYKADENVNGNLTTVYADRVCANIAHSGEKVTFAGKTYADMTDFCLNYYNADWSGREKQHINDVKELALYFFDYESGKSATLACVMRYDPLACAMKGLLYIYLVAAFVFAAVTRFILSAVLKNLAAPLHEMAARVPETWKTENLTDGKYPIWREPYEAEQYFLSLKEQLRAGQTERTRLETALDYAQDAEKNRRRMVSDIAHELKTPLAVINSYSEGLLEHIAEDKREKYLAVIMDEVGEMDGMIAEMLDLSRLEAGRVKLSSDEFSLKEVTESVFERLALALEAKELSLRYDVDEREKMRADEARITQVITNLATNAIKYTPTGGIVCVRISARRGKVRFAIENQSEPLSDDALKSVWETFYRADASRKSEGTGLGLAIVKNIVELHGGTVFARNTEIGVEFGFDL